MLPDKSVSYSLFHIWTMLNISGCSDCYTCDSYKCVAHESSNSGSTAGVSKGAVAGAVIAVLILLGLSVFAFLWYRKRSQRLRAQADFADIKPEVPAAAETVLNRPDPSEKPTTPTTDRSNVRVYSTSSNTTIDLDPESTGSARAALAYAQSQHSESLRSNPFDDNNSIQTAGTEGTNVIPIALVTPDPHRQSGQISTTSSVPSRPARSPDLNLQHVNVSADSIQPPRPADAQSQISGISGINRNSYMSSASYASEFLNEAPMIMTPKRQVLGGLGKAEFVNAPGSTSEVNLLKIPGVATKPIVRSPLAATAFTSGDTNSVSDSASIENPFSDKHVSTTTTQDPSSPPPTASAFAQRESTIDEAQEVSVPWDHVEHDLTSRPTSMNTQAGSIIGIESATRVNFGSDPTRARQTMGRLVTPPSGGSMAAQLQEQQRRALDTRLHAPSEGARRDSTSSAFSTTADSILESFSFSLDNAPPLPTIAQSPRTPPRSPAFANMQDSRNMPSHFITPPTPNREDVAGDDSDDSDLPAPPNRRTLGLSTGSQFSTASSGLGSFPFQIDSGTSSGDDLSGIPTDDRRRASLDTLAITSDLSSYPLSYDRPPVPRSNLNP